MNRSGHEKLTETVLGEAVVRLLSKNSSFSGAMLLRCLQEMAVKETDPERLQALSAQMTEVQTKFIPARNTRRYRFWCIPATAENTDKRKFMMTDNYFPGLFQGP